jgi:cytochrome c oxidase cbb3-type subunit III
MRRVTVGRAWASAAGFRAGFLGVAVGSALFAQPGPARPDIDPDSADRGKRVYRQLCVDCHGNLAKGSEDGPDLIRSTVILHDRAGSELGPALKKLPNHPRDLAPRQLQDLSQFLRQRIEETVKNRTAATPPNVLTGDAKAGQAYFNAKCAACHSPAGDLARIASRYDPVTLQQRFLFPRSGGRGGPEPKRSQVTVTPASGTPVSGALERVDDFYISLRDASGDYRSWTRNPDLKVEIQDPYAAHDRLLEEYADADIHNIVAYLESLR